MKKNPLVSIIMNCHNGEKYLEKSIMSILNQSYSNWELIFWDNLSSDNSIKILKKFSDKRIKLFKSKNYTSLYKARNLAIEKSKGKYIAFLDTDDIWKCNKLKEQIKFLQKNNKYKIVFSNFIVYNESKKTKFIKYNFDLPFGDITQNLLDEYSLGIVTVLLEKSIFKKFKFNINYNIIGDFDFFINISKFFKIGCIQKPLAVYRYHSSSLSSNRLDTYIKEEVDWIKRNENKLRKKGFSVYSKKFYIFKLKIKYLVKKYLN